MIIQSLTSIHDNIRQRVTNPFLGTFILVWISYHWELVYSFFFFDEDKKLQSRLSYFCDYWSTHSFGWSLLYVALITFAVQIAVFILLTLSRAIGNLYENYAIPYVTKITKGVIVTAEVHQRVLDRISELEERVEQERKQKIEARTELERRDREQVEAMLNKPAVIPNPANERPKKDRIDQLIEKVTTADEHKSINTVLLRIARNEVISPNEFGLHFLLKHNLAERDSRYTGERYLLTTEGKEFMRRFSMREDDTQ